MKYPLVLAALLLSGVAVFTGCSQSEPRDVSLDQVPIVVVSEPVPSDSNAHAHNCDVPGTLCGTITGRLFQDSQKIFQIEVPEGWGIRGSELTDDSMIIGSPSDHAFLEIRRQQPDPNLFAYSQDDFQQTYQVGVTDFRILSFEKVSVQGLPALHLVYECSDGGTAYHFDQFIISGSFDYNITMIQRPGETDRSAEFAQLIQTFQQLSPQDASQQNQGKLVGTLYTAPDSSYSISLPEGWRIDPTQDFMSAQSADHSAALTILVNVADPKLMDSSQEQFQQYYAKLFSDVQISLFEKTSVSGVQALHLVCSYQSNGKPIIAEQFLIPTASHTYSLTFTKAGTQTDPLFATSAKSFQLS